MAGIALKFTVRYSDREVLRYIQQLESAAGNLRDAFVDIGEYLDLSTRMRFDREEEPDGSAWEPLSDQTVLRATRKGSKRKRRSSNKKILVESGDLRDTLRYEASGTALVFGSDRIYAATHQFGDPSRNIPARPFLGISDEDRDEIIAILKDHLDRTLKV